MIAYVSVTLPMSTAKKRSNDIWFWLNGALTAQVARPVDPSTQFLEWFLVSRFFIWLDCYYHEQLKLQVFLNY